MRAIRGRAEWVLSVFAAIGLSCGGDDGGNDANTQLTGAVWYSGPVAGAEVVAYQLVEGERTTEVGRATTDDAGAFVLDLGLAYESIELEARGGSYDEATGGRIALNNADVLRGIALDVAPAEQRGDLSITPWSHLVVTLGEARLARGDKEATYNDAMTAARDLLEAHIGFDPAQTPFARLDLDAGSPTEPVLQSLSLAGLGSLGAAVATEGGLTAQDVNTSDVTTVLATDLGSDEALFDGNGDILTLGPACGLPPGCTARGDDCRSTCQVYWNTVRSRLALAIAGFLQDEHNGTGLAREDLQSYLAALTNNEEPELFGGPVEPLDDLGPEITWVTPTSGATVADTISVEVTAADPIGVASLVVDVVGLSTTAIADTIAAAETFTGPLNTALYAEGELTLRATAVDDEGNATTADLTITLDNVDGGVLSGVVFKGPVGGATVEVYRYPNGVKGALLGSGITTSDGTFINVAIADGYAGPLLVEAGGAGSYSEESAPATTVTLDVTDKLRTVIASYTDGDTLANGVVTPLTSFAVTYYEYLRTQLTGTFDAVWATAHAAIEAHFAVPDILTLIPQRPVEMTTFSSPAKYGLVLAGLSRTAWDASNQAGGDGGSFGSAMNAVRVWRVLDQDLADGCWNGKAGATSLVFGGTQAVTPTTVRSDLADEIVSYLGSAQNATAFTGAADVLPLLETMSQSGPATGVGNACGAGEMFPTPGRTYDQVAPVVVFEAPTPAASSLVRLTISLRATATDDLTAPIASWAAPVGLTDTDGVAGNAIVTSSYDTTSAADGDVTVTASAVDGSGNIGTASRTFTVDNTPPTLTWTSTGFLVDASPEVWWTQDSGPALAGTTTDMHSATVAVLIGASTYPAIVAGSAWSVDLPTSAVASSATTVTVRATDAAGNITTLAHTLRSDTTDVFVTMVPTDVSVEGMGEVDFLNSPVKAWCVAGQPCHTHTSSGTSLGTSPACDASAPAVYKFAYLLDEAAPNFANENAKNPLEWAFNVTDDGVGIDPTASAYRVRQGGVTLVDWRSLSDGSGVTGGLGYVVPLYRKVSAATWPAIAALGTVDGLFAIDVRGKDRLGREISQTRCWNHHPLAAPFEISAAVAATDGNSATGKWALAQLQLSQNDPISAQVLNASAPGAGLVEFTLKSAVTENIYVTLDLPNVPTSAAWTKSYQYTHYLTLTTSSYNCGCDLGASCTGITAECANTASLPASVVVADQPGSLPAPLSARFAIRLYRKAGSTYTEISPCAGCGANRFLLPARNLLTDLTPLEFVAMVVIKTIAEVRPAAVSTADDAPPYAEITLGGTVYTGKLHETTKRCASAPTYATVQDKWSCTMRDYRRYRALGKATMNFVGSVTSNVTAAPTAALVGELRGSPSLLNPPAWTTSETLPTPIPAP